jgi:hypothetical protein
MVSQKSRCSYFDEELTIDYAMTDDEPYEMECQCGSEACRKLITGADWRQTELQKKI